MHKCAAIELLGGDGLHREGNRNCMVGAPEKKKSKTICGTERKLFHKHNTELHTLLVSQKMITTKVANYKPGAIATHRGFHSTSKSLNNLPFNQATQQRKTLFWHKQNQATRYRTGTR